MVCATHLRYGIRALSTVGPGYTNSSTKIPGFHIIQKFLGVRERDELFQESRKLHEKICNYLQNQEGLKSYPSKNHNLKSKECYQLIKVTDKNRSIIEGQHFEKYGHEGHRLTYFIGNRNLPWVCQNYLLLRVLAIPEVRAIAGYSPLTWNTTFNTYALAKNRGPKIRGFGFHKDIAENGDVSMIYSMGGPAMLQIRHPDDPSTTEAHPLDANSLVILSREARWDYEHSVTPITDLGSSPVEKIRRMSLVLGFTINKPKIDSQLEDKALQLIWSSRSYGDFTGEEKAIVNAYQEWIWNEDALVLPNTARALEVALD